MISNEFSCRFGNWCLQIYKTFRFCQLKNIDFSIVKFKDSRLFKNELGYNPFLEFSNLKDYFIPEEQFDQIVFNKRFFDSKDIQSLEYDEKDNLLFGQWNWIYPQTIEEFCLFNTLFDNREYTRKIFEQHKDIFQNVRPVLGYTVRFGMDWYGRRMMSSEELKNNICEIRRRYFNLVKIVITSDNINQCKEALAGINNVVFIDGLPPEEQVTLLSLCDYVVNNDSWFIGDRVRGQCDFESTFGQIGQCLALSRKYIDFA